MEGGGKHPSARHVRNLCVLAHVDHGKTSLTDSLVSASGYINAHHAGQLRYMDFREDEQRRGITMKSAAVVLLHKYCTDGENQKNYIVNLIDSPGHVDFSGEVEAAISICDGSILVVDVVEGVCAQTVTVLRLALERGVQPVLVLNKMDRLFTELRLTPMDAYQHITHVLELVNVIVGVRDLENVIRASETFTGAGDEQETDGSKQNGADAASGRGWSIDDAEVDSVYFSPENGNVAFASAVDGWGFRIDQFASLYSKKFGLSRRNLMRTLWGDFYMNPKSKRIIHDPTRKSVGSAAKPMFVSFILDNIWKVYEAVEKSDPESLEKRRNIIEKLGLKVNRRDYEHRDSKIAVRSILGAWLPASRTILDMVVEKLPSPDIAQRQRLRMLWPHPRPENPDDVQHWSRIKEAIESCDASDDAPLVAFVAKMITKPKESTQGKIRQPRAQEELNATRGTTSTDERGPNEADDDSATIAKMSEPFVAFTRILSGSVRKDRAVHVYGPRFNRGRTDQGYSEATITNVLLLMGRDMTTVDKVAAGSICGLEGLEDVVLKTATISSSRPEQAYPLTSRMAFTEQSGELVVRVALEPHTPMETEGLQLGLKRLNQADPMVDTFITATGELVLAVTGELHLERCLVDLRERFATGVRFHVSPPIIAFRETVSIVGTAVVAQTANKQVTVKLRASPLPASVARLLDEESLRIRGLLSEARQSDSPLEQLEGAKSVREQLCATFAGEETLFKDVRDRLWASGPRNFGPNLLLGLPWCDTKTKGIATNRKLFFDEDAEEDIGIAALIVNGIIAGFQHATAAGPLCEEPMHGVCLSIEDIHVEEEVSGGDSYGPLSGQIISCVKEACRNAMMASKPRLMEALLRVEIQTDVESLGGMYTVLSKRRGRIVREEIKEGASIFEVIALIPVVESFGFADVLRVQTSGQASPQMIRSHWEMLEQDPLWEPQTEEELEDWSLDDKTVANNNLAAKLMNRTRRRKGLHVVDKVVDRAEKQRTLKRK